MAARAEIMARLGLDRSGFTKGIDGAKQEAAGFEGSLGSVKRGIQMAFAVLAIKEFADTARELRQYQDDKGITLVSPDQLDLIERSGDAIDGLMLKAKAYAVTGFGMILKGWETFTARLGAMSTGASWKEAGQTAAEQTTGGASDEARVRAAAELKKQTDANVSSEKELDRMRTAAMSTRDRLAKAQGEEAQLSREVSAMLRVINADELYREKIKAKQIEQQKAMIEASRLETQLEKEQQAIREAGEAKRLKAIKERQQEEQQRASTMLAMYSSSMAEYKAMMKSDRERAEIMAGKGVNLPPIDADAYARFGGTIGRQAGAEMRSEQRRMQILENLNAWLTRNNEGGGLGD